MEALVEAVLENRNVLFLTVSVIIALGGGVLVLAKYIISSKKRPVIWILGAVIMLCLVAAALVKFAPTWFSLRGDEYTDAVFLGLQLLLTLFIGTAFLEICEKRGQNITENGRKIAFIGVFVLMQAWGGMRMLLEEGSVGSAFLISDTKGSILGFYNSIMHAREEIGVSAGYWGSPLSSLIAKLFARSMPAEGYNTLFPASLGILPVGQLALVIFTIVMVAICYWGLCVAQGGKLKLLESVFSWCMLLSVPFISSYVSADISLVAVACVLFFVGVRSTQSGPLREAALLLLSLAIAVKPPMVVFALLLLLDKDFLGFLRICVYSIILFVVPVMALGGIPQLHIYALLMKEQLLCEIYCVRPESLGISFASVFNNLTDLFLNDSGIARMQILAGWGLSAVMLICACFQKDWKRILCLTLVVGGFLHVNTGNIALYLIVPCVVFLGSDKKICVWDEIYLFLFACIFIVFPAPWLQNIGFIQLRPVGDQSMIMLIQSSALFSMVITVLIESIIGVIDALKESMVF